MYCELVAKDLKKYKRCKFSKLATLELTGDRIVPAEAFAPNPFLGKGYQYPHLSGPALTLVLAWLYFTLRGQGGLRGYWSMYLSISS